MLFHLREVAENEDPPAKEKESHRSRDWDGIGVHEVQHNGQREVGRPREKIKLGGTRVLPKDGREPYCARNEGKNTCQTKKQRGASNISQNRLRERKPRRQADISQTRERDPGAYALLKHKG